MRPNSPPRGRSGWAELARPHLHLWVADTGPGIPPELAERIFEPFATSEQVQRRAGGIGLGLSITRHLVTLHEGVITVQSQPGQGTTFHIYLPLPEPGERDATLGSGEGNLVAHCQRGPRLRPRLSTLVSNNSYRLRCCGREMTWKRYWPGVARRW